jgi:hypothetical protein
MGENIIFPHPLNKLSINISLISKISLKPKLLDLCKLSNPWLKENNLCLYTNQSNQWYKHN